MLCLSAIAGACSSSPTRTPATGGTSEPAPSPALPGSEPTPGGPDPTPAGQVTPEPRTPEPQPTAAATGEPVRPTPAATAAQTPPPPAGTAACTGTEENQAFYAAVASAVDWSVYCPSLPRGWLVQSGQYRLADGGRLQITYRGPNGSWLMLQEGAFCPAGDCVPPGDDRGEVPFGDRSGTLVRTADGFAVSVGAGERPSWLLLVNGQTEEAVRAIAADLVRVGN